MTKEYDLRIATVGACGLIVVNVVLLYYFTTAGNYFLAIASTGVITFVGILSLANYVSIEPSISKEEMRDAITASIVVVYVIMIALEFSGSGTIGDAPKEITDHFTWVVGIVVVFYFGSKGVLHYLDAKNMPSSTTKQKTQETSSITI